MDEQTMFELLEVYDAVQGVELIQEMLCGESYGCGYGEGIIGNLSYVYNIIKRHSRTQNPVQILNNKEIDNHQKARLLLDDSNLM